MLQRDNLNVLITGLVNAVDNVDHARNVGGTVRDDEHVAAGMCDQVTVLRNQWPQDGNELGRADIAQLDDGCGHVIGPRGTFNSHATGELPGRRVRDDLDQIAAIDRYVAVHLEDRQESLVQRVRPQRRW